MRGCATTAPLPHVGTLGQFASHSRLCLVPQLSQAQGLRAGVYWRSLSGTHSSLLPQVALDAPGWGRL